MVCGEKRRRLRYQPPKRGDKQPLSEQVSVIYPPPLRPGAISLYSKEMARKRRVRKSSQRLRLHCSRAITTKLVCPLRLTSSTADLPLFCFIARSNSATLLTGRRLTCWITSPRRRPA